MTDMLERAAAELVSVCEDAGCVGPDGAAQHLAREVITAAFDPEDEALETAIARAVAPELFAALEQTENIGDAYRMSRDAREVRIRARAVIATIAAMAQGGQDAGR